MLYRDLNFIIGKLRKTGACHKQYSLKVNAEEVRLPVRLKKTLIQYQNKLEGGSSALGCGMHA